MKRTVLLCEIRNNKNSVPPLSLRLIQAAPVHRTALTAGQLTLVADGGAGGYTYSATGLPAGLSLNTATGEITGTPTTIGHNVITATVTDSASNTFTTTFSIDVASRLYVVAGTPPELEYGLPSVSYQFEVGGATGTVTWSTSSTLPDFITFDSSGLFSGSYTLLPGVFPWPFVVTATDSGTGDTITFNASFNCYSALTPNPIYPDFGQATIPLVSGFTGLDFGGKLPYTYWADPIPAWMEFDPQTVTLSGIPQAADVGASNQVTLHVRDALGVETSSTAYFTISRAPQVAIQLQKAATDVGLPGPLNLNFEFPTSGTPDVVDDGDTRTVTIPTVAGAMGHGSTTTTAAPSASGGNWVFTVADTAAFNAAGLPIYCSDGTNSIRGHVVSVASSTQLTVAPDSTSGTVSSIANGSTFTFSGVAGPAGTVQSVVAGTNVTVDNTDPANPVVNASGGGGGGSTLPPILYATSSSTQSGWEGVTLRVSIGPENVFQALSSLIASVECGSTGMVINNAYACKAKNNSQGYPIEFDGTPTRLLFGGSNGVTISGAGIAISDVASVSVPAKTPIVLAFEFPSTPALTLVNNIAYDLIHARSYYITGADASNTSTSGYATSSGGLAGTMRVHGG